MTQPKRRLSPAAARKRRELARTRLVRLLAQTESPTLSEMPLRKLQGLQERLRRDWSVAVGRSGLLRARLEAGRSRLAEVVEYKEAMIKLAAPMRRYRRLSLGQPNTKALIVAGAEMAEVIRRLREPLLGRILEDAGIADEASFQRSLVKLVERRVLELVAILESNPVCEEAFDELTGYLTGSSVDLGEVELDVPEHYNEWMLALRAFQDRPVRKDDFLGLPWEHMRPYLLSEPSSVIRWKEVLRTQAAYALRLERDGFAAMARRHAKLVYSFVVACCTDRRQDLGLDPSDVLGPTYLPIQLLVVGPEMPEA